MNRLDTAGFGFAPDAIFGQLDNMAKRAILSLIAAIGLMLIYSHTEIARFQVRVPASLPATLTSTLKLTDDHPQTQTSETDLYSSFFFFLSSRLPFRWLLISILGLKAVLLMMVVAEALVRLQGIVYGVHYCWGGGGEGGAQRSTDSTRVLPHSASPRHIQDDIYTPTPT